MAWDYSKSFEELVRERELLRKAEEELAVRNKKYRDELEVKTIPVDVSKIYTSE